MLSGSVSFAAVYQLSGHLRVLLRKSNRGRLPVAINPRLPLSYAASDLADQAANRHPFRSLTERKTVEINVTAISQTQQRAVIGHQQAESVERTRLHTR